MAVKTVKEIMDSLQSRIGENADDETLHFLEDVTDTFSDLESKATGDGTDWKSKYEENDKTWREKYKARFFSKTPEDEKPPEETTEDEKHPTTFEELFTKEV